MHLTRKILTASIFTALCISVFPGNAQLGFSFDIKKPQQYDDRVLGSEKSESKKFTTPRRFVQNTFTHYNYFFNANNKLNEVIELAKSVHVDDYSKLLSFYNYSLEVTAQNKNQLDSVIYKSSTGIVLHDLRNDWIDNLYLLTGAAFYLRQQFDSAYLTFQFINYAFADKEKDGYYKNIGSNLDGNNAFSIASKEKNSIPRKVFSEPPSRNESFIWLIRTLIAQEEYAESASLIITLKNDPLFPKRLQNDLEEVQALWFYNNNIYDSAALHLSKALDNAPTAKEKARWEFLVAQLYERTGKQDLAKSFYDDAIKHTTDPVLEIYARLHSIRMNKQGGENYLDQNIAELLKMAKRDKYTDYRDVIYYTLAQIEIERGNFDAGQKYLAKSTEYNTSNTQLKNKAWLQMGEIAFNQKKYRQSHNSYDSVDYNDPTLKDIKSLLARKDLVGKIATQIEIIERQDSLQRIAAMPEDQRRDFVRKITRQLRKEQGLKEESGNLIPIGKTEQISAPDLFTTSSGKGEWYFYNAASRTRGLAEFKSKWGNRANADNWRRISSANLSQNAKTLVTTEKISLNGENIPGEINFDALYERLPLTDTLLKLSNDSISNALYILGKALMDEAEDCKSSIKANEELIVRFPHHEKTDEVLFSLYYCYTKTGDQNKAAAIKKLMVEKHAGSPLTAIISTGKDPRNKATNPTATKTYEHIYDLFIEGNFEQAIAEKTSADAQYGSFYWTPQLLYIESVYYIKQKQDEKAVETLNKIVKTFPNTPMAEKATTLISVLGRRKEIENELLNSNVVRPKEIPVKKTDSLVVNPPAKNEVVLKKPDQQVIQPAAADKPVVVVKDSITSKPAVAAYSFNPADKYSVLVLLNKVDMVWANEAKNAFNIYNRGKYYSKPFVLNVTDISGETRGLIIESFENAQSALDYMQAAKSASTSQIMPWLNADRYSFTIISASNLEILKSLKDINSYKQFIEKNLPGKF